MRERESVCECVCICVSACVYLDACMYVREREAGDGKIAEKPVFLCNKNALMQDVEREGQGRSAHGE